MATQPELQNDKQIDSNEDSTQASTSKTLLEQNGFTVIRKIGTGSYSKVKLAYSNTHKTMVAIKTVSKHHVPEEFLKKFLYNEVKVVRFLKHENIIKYYQSIETSHKLYVIMQHATNGSILDLIHKQKYISEPRACFLFRQIMSAIEYCHSKGIAHRDLKCENVMLDDKFNVKLIDFGFAKSGLGLKEDSPKLPGEEKLQKIFLEKSSFVKKQEKEGNLSETYCGSYAYASPEILKGTPYDPFMSDVWAMGVVLFAMVFGRLPFDDRDPAKLIRQVLMPINFPFKVTVSDEVKMCIKKFLSPLKSRYTIEKIKDDIWISTAYLAYNPQNVVNFNSRNVYTR
ncbi:hypothetical protein PVAND_006261 [Polypedilum vanderplanki]|uniref:Protein kinase domain-containing protein n=1 Tax=Polypedilum vanderplanki TaxID=319348 RepID=A0A9J6C336_POLVA|nr:hypothetical protein PVAND_006261 [Polypedilum vanderplanki]